MKPALLCIGAAAVDRTFVLDGAPISATSNPARAYPITFGGVARNVAENLARLGADVALVSTIGTDAEGRALLTDARDSGINVGAVAEDSASATAQYVAVMGPSGELAIGISCAQAIEEIDAQSLRARVEAAALQIGYWFVDCNLSAAALASVIALARDRGARIAVDGVSVAKIARLPKRLDGIDILFCNNDEAASYVDEELRDGAAAEALCKRGAARAVVTAGARGAFVAGDVSAHVPAVTAKLINATGAGDAFIAATLYALVGGESVANALRLGAVAAAFTIESPQSVCNGLTLTRLQARLSAENV